MSQAIKVQNGVVLISAITAVELIKPSDPENGTKILIYSGGKSFLYYVGDEAEAKYNALLFTLNISSL